jgi:chorismate synthase
MLRFVTAGESHGRCLTGVIEGLPSGLPIDIGFIDRQLHRRQLGYGRGRRMKIESDRIQITSGVRHGRTLGSPVSFVIENKDWENWKVAMSAEAPPENAAIRALTRPRPGHADLAGALKHETHDARNVLERASARETAARVAVGSFCRLLLREFDLHIASHVLAIGGLSSAAQDPGFPAILALDDDSPLRCLDKDLEARMAALIDQAEADGNTLGGIAEIVASPVPPGLGSHTQWDRKLDGKLAQALMSIPAVKAVEIGQGCRSAQCMGSEVHDEIHYDQETHRFGHGTNRAGGIEGGITNGADLYARIFVKPIPTLRRALQSVDLITKEPSAAAFERSDTCVVPAAGIIGEAMLGIVLADAFLEKFGGDSLGEIKANSGAYMHRLREY